MTIHLLARAIALAFCFVAAASAAAQEVDRDALRNEAFEAAQKAMATSAGQALAQLGVRFASGSGELAELVRRRQDHVEAWKAADRRLVQVTAAAGGDRSEQMEALRAEVAGLQDKIAADDGALSERFPAYAELSQPRPMTIAAAQAQLGDDEALAMIFVGENETFVWAMTRGAATWHRVVAKRSDLSERVKGLRLGLDPKAPAVAGGALRTFGEAVVEGGVGLERVAFRRAEAHRLWTELLAPVQDVIGRAARLFVVAESPFDSLPFSLLVTEPPQGEDDDPAALRATAWLIRQHALVTLPSVSSLRALRAGDLMARAPEPFRGYGAPTFGTVPRTQVALRSAGTAASVFEAGRSNLDSLRALAPLPQTENELRRLGAALGASADEIRLGMAATEGALKRDDLSRYRVLAFATHGLVAGEIGGLVEPALAFTPPSRATDEDDGLLTASEAAKLNLTADWVILSACNTASGDGTPGADGLSGLARAFFYAGARTLLVSHWPVRDDAAARLTTEAFALLGRGDVRGKADAFRRSVLALIDDRRDPSLAHPAIWAPFVVVGEGR